MLSRSYFRQVLFIKFKNNTVKSMIRAPTPILNLLFLIYLLPIYSSNDTPVMWKEASVK